MREFETAFDTKAKPPTKPRNAQQELTDAIDLLRSRARSQTNPAVRRMLFTKLVGIEYELQQIMRYPDMTD
jgi:hypothetical protein